MISIVSYSMLFLAWCITFFSLGRAWKYNISMRNENLRIIGIIKNLHEEIAKLKKEDT